MISDTRDDAVSRIGWRIVQAIHEHIPAERRPQSWSDLSESQNERVERTAINIIEQMHASHAAENALLRATLRDTIAAFDVAAIALDTAGDKIAASVAAAAIGNARKGLEEDRS